MPIFFIFFTLLLNNYVILDGVLLPVDRGHNTYNLI